MGPLDHLDVSADELAELVRGEVWQRWLLNEPMLARLGSLAELRERRGSEADQLLGALVRLAAKDGGDDELAARAVAYQLAGEAVRVAIELRDLGPDVDLVVLASLWLEICSFPSRRRTRAFATSIRMSTRRSALRYLLSRPCERGRLVMMPPEDIAERAVPAVPCLPGGATAAESREELVEYLRWCVEGGRVTQEEAALMLELVAAGWQTADRGVLKLKRGVCSLHAVQVVADRRGRSAKSIIRERDRVLGLLRSAAVDYFLDVA
jgi:hypothetical protein